MADKDFKVKNKLFINGLTHNSGVLLAENKGVDSHTNLATQYGGTGTTQSPNAGQVLYSSSGTTYAPANIESIALTPSSTSTLTNKTISLSGNTISGSISDFNASLTDDNFATQTDLLSYKKDISLSVNSNTNLVDGRKYFVDTSTSVTLTLPASPVIGNEIVVVDQYGQAATNKIVINSNSNKINGVVQNLEIDVNNAAVVLIYTGSSYGWRVG